MESPGVNVNPGDASEEDVQAGSSKLGLGFFSMRREKEDRRRAAHNLRMQMKDLQFRLRELDTTGGSDSDDSIFVEPLGVWQRKTKAVFEKTVAIMAHQRSFILQNSRSQECVLEKEYRRNVLCARLTQQHSQTSDKQVALLKLDCKFVLI